MAHGCLPKHRPRKSTCDPEKHENPTRYRKLLLHHAGGSLFGAGKLTLSQFSCFVSSVPRLNCGFLGASFECDENPTYPAANA